MTATATPPAQLRSIESILRRIAVVGLAGVISGIAVGGVLGRIMMRIAALAAREKFGLPTEAGNTIGEITVEGTLGLIIFVGIFSGGIGAVLYVATEEWLAWAGRWRGLAFGGVLLAIGGAASTALEPDNIDFLVLGHPFLNVPMLVSLFFLYGIMIEWLIGVLGRRMPEVSGAGVAGYAIIVAAGAPFILLTLMGTAGVNGSGCDCAPPLLAFAGILLMAAATGTMWAIELSGRSSPRIVGLLGHLGLIAAVGAGGRQAIANITAILT